ncbi:hypothetical protein DUNSADRAFT_6150 [Dunaliella salina]|uniref:Uncharacterized protein n=1 Tax=Dunaliella salina TaxID=3046 RepID=A0ABQ7GP05_DUNSA|nr:hypothetical protein DUNSADRAFT_6150 [Dunaliella salina]|eukprot:KAF5836320.1 hypothetical protein DUNSADRAFT_6150 [Dunaliella salina]
MQETNPRYCAAHARNQPSLLRCACRDAVCAILPKLLTREATYDAAWVTGPGPNRYCIHFALDDGMLRSVEFTPQYYLHGSAKGTVHFAAGHDPACMWSVDYSPITTALAYGGDDGIVALGVAECCSDTRNKRPHVPIGGLVSDAGVLRVAGPRQLAGVPCVYGGGSAFGAVSALGGTKAQGKGNAPAASSALRDSVQMLHTVRWSPNTQSSPTEPSSDGCQCTTQAAWLAYGGAAGLVRCQRLALQL